MVILSRQWNIFLFSAELCVRKPSSAAELKRKQTTAVVLLGVIGAEFGQDMGQEAPSSAAPSSAAPSAAPTPTGSGATLVPAAPANNNKRRSSQDVRRKSSVVEGFGLGNNNLARLTSEYKSARRSAAGSSGAAATWGRR